MSASASAGESGISWMQRVAAHSPDAWVPPTGDAPIAARELVGDGWSEIREAALSLSEISRWRGLAAVATQWLVIAGAFTLVLFGGQWWTWLVAALVVGSRQHALGILMHEAAHFRLHPNRAVNDAVGDFLCALPVGMSLALYRRHHLQHHNHTNDEHDTDAHW